MLRGMNSRTLLTRSVVAVAALASLAMTGCRANDPPVWLSEEPAESGTWVAAAGAPDWVTNPPPRDGAFVFVVEGRSNLRGIAAGKRSPHPDHDLAKLLKARLEPLADTGVANPVDLAVAVAVRSLRMTRRACCEEILTRKAVPGNTLCTAWAMWETPVEPIAACFPEASRPAVRAALAAPEGVPMSAPQRPR